MSSSRAKVNARRSDLKSLSSTKEDDKEKIVSNSSTPRRVPRSLSTVANRRLPGEPLKARSFVENPHLNTPKDDARISSPITSEVFKDAMDAPAEVDAKSDIKSELSESKKSSGIPLRKSGNGRSPDSVITRKPSTSIKHIPSSSTPSKSGSFIRVSSATKQSLEIQFKTKKKRLDMLKKELIGKQKPVLDLYQALVELKKKLEQTGTHNIHLDELKFIDCDYKEDPTAGGEQKLNSEALGALKSLIEKLVSPVVDCCKNVIVKRADILDTLKSNPDAIKTKIDTLKVESEEIEQNLEEICSEQNRNIMYMINYLEKVLKSTNTVLEVPSHFADEYEIEHLRQQLRDNESKLAENGKLVHDLQEESRKKCAMVDELNKYKHHVIDMKLKIKQLETDLELERKQTTEIKSKSQNFDHKLRTIKLRLQEADNKAKDLDQKYKESENKVRNLQDNIKLKEVQWAREKEDYQKNVKSQELMIQKLSADRIQLETRLRSGDELLRDTEQKFLVKIDGLLEELETARTEAIDARNEKDQLQKKCDYFNEQLTKSRVQSQQAVDLIANRSDSGCDRKDNPSESEERLYAELLTTRLTLKDYEEKIKMYELEKLRFIDTISYMTQDKDNEYSSIRQTLMQQEETINRLEAALKEKDEFIQEKIIMVENLEAEVRSLKQRLESAVVEADAFENSQDLVSVIQEGKFKLDEAMNKSLEHEQRIIQYQHECDKKSKQLNEMENLVKVRDGLIGMLKAKKDELIGENESLRRYANEVRNLLLEAKDDLKSRTEMIQELSISLDNKEKTCHRLEKKVHDLEGTLTINNEKRFKLQDTIGTMEKELQNTKAHMNQLSDSSRTRVKFL